MLKIGVCQISRNFNKFDQFLRKLVTNKGLNCCYSVDVKMELITDSDEKNHPQCPHGPTFLLKKTDKERGTSRKFYSCSANRNRKFCSFFHWYDEPITPLKRRTWESIAKQHLNSLNLNELRARQNELQECTTDNRLKFCRKCALILFSNEWCNHTSHGKLEEVLHTGIQMKPTTFLSPLEENKSNAQYFFSDNCVKFIVESLKEAGVNKVVGIGVPKISEYILSRKSDLKMECLLMDIDHRYAQFYTRQEFVLYNMFNHHFFEGPASEKIFLDFVRSPERTALVIDPPFGGLISAIAQTIRKISEHKRGEEQMPVLLFFPYFNEDRILKEMPTLQMLDYKVDYINHSKFKAGKSRQGSIVRIYTNLDVSTFVLPADEGYRFCSDCKRYVSKENKHCKDCNLCTSKDGKAYKHCQKCGRCCKSTWEHCLDCNKCVLPEHPCQTSPDLRFKGEPRKRIKR